MNTLADIATCPQTRIAYGHAVTICKALYLTGEGVWILTDQYNYSHTLAEWLAYEPCTLTHKEVMSAWYEKA